MRDVTPIPPARAAALTAAQEAALLRAAVARKPDARALRLRLAALLIQLDAFDETIALLSAIEAGPADYPLLMALATAHLGRETAADNRAAAAITETALALAGGDAARAAALADQAKAWLRLDMPVPALELLEQALRLDPHNKAAFRRLTTHWFGRGDAGAVLSLIERLTATGVNHARLHAARAAAFAALGRIEEARAATGFATFASHQQLAVPAGWATLEAFNAALTDELLAHPGMRFERYGTASARSWRIDAPTDGDAPLARALIATILPAIEGYVASITGHAHPWIVARPPQLELHSWCVITAGDGHENWHHHPFAWLSGGYYVQVPDGEDPDGCIAFGLPPGLVGAEAAAAFGETLIRPRAGSLMLFPAPCYHRTYRHNRDARRICVAFDLRPVEDGHP